MRTRSLILATLLCISTIAAAQTPPAADNGGVRLNIPPAPAPETKPPVDLTPPREPATEPPARSEPAPQDETSTSPAPPPAWEADLPPRGEGAAAIPNETPYGVKAIGDWIRSWFE